MILNALLVLLDIAAGLFFLCRAFVAIVHMSRRTGHCIRLTFCLLCAGAFGALLSPLMDADWRRYAHVAIISALMLKELLDRRQAQADSRSETAPRDRRSGPRQGIERDLA